MTLPTRPTGNFGALDEGALISFNPIGLRAIEIQVRDLLGRFTTLQTPMRRGFEQMAQRAQIYIVLELAKRIATTGRAQRPNSLLLNAMRSRANWDANAEGFIVGTKQALESGPTKYYYRNLEYGTNIFVGRELRGFFISQQGKASPALRDRVRQDPRLIQTNKFFAGTKGAREELARQKREGDFRPGLQRYGRTEKRLPAPKIGKDGRAPGGFRIIIRRPIPAYQYFLVGSQRYLETKHPQEVIRQICKDAGIPYTG